MWYVYAAFCPFAFASYCFHLWIDVNSIPPCDYTCTRYPAVWMGVPSLQMRGGRIGFFADTFSTDWNARWNNVWQITQDVHFFNFHVSFRTSSKYFSMLDLIWFGVWSMISAEIVMPIKDEELGLKAGRARLQFRNMIFERWLDQYWLLGRRESDVPVQMYIDRKGATLGYNTRRAQHSYHLTLRSQHKFFDPAYLFLM